MHPPLYICFIIRVSKTGCQVSMIMRANFHMQFELCFLNTQALCNPLNFLPLLYLILNQQHIKQMPVLEHISSPTTQNVTIHLLRHLLLPHYNSGKIQLTFQTRVSLARELVVTPSTKIRILNAHFFASQVTKDIAKYMTRRPMSIQLIE